MNIWRQRTAEEGVGSVMVLQHEGSYEMYDIVKEYKQSFAFPCPQDKRSECV